MHHDDKPADLIVEADGEVHPVTEAEAQLIEPYLGDLIPAILLFRDEEE